MHLERTEAGHCMRVLCIIPLILMLTVEYQFYWKDSGLAGVEFQFPWCGKFPFIEVT